MNSVQEKDLVPGYLEQANKTRFIVELECFSHEETPDAETVKEYLQYVCNSFSDLGFVKVKGVKSVDWILERLAAFKEPPQSPTT